MGTLKSTVALIAPMLLLSVTDCFAVETYHALECSGTQKADEIGGYASPSGNLYCYSLHNTCGAPIALKAIDEVTHVPTGSGEVKDQQDGKVCASHPISISLYYVYRQKGASNDWNGSVFSVQSRLCDTIGNPCRDYVWRIAVSGDSVTQSSGAANLTYRLNGTTTQALGAGGVSTLRAHLANNALVLDDSSTFPGAQSRNSARFTITKHGSGCSASYTSRHADALNGKSRSWNLNMTSGSCEISSSR